MAPRQAWPAAVACHAWAGLRCSLDERPLLRVVLLSGGGARALCRVVAINAIVCLGWGSFVADHALWPWVRDQLDRRAALSPALADAWLKILRMLSSALFLLPAACASLAVSSACFQRLAVAARAVAAAAAAVDDGRARGSKASRPLPTTQQPSQPPPPPPPPPLEAAAASLVRLLIYVVLAAEAALLGRVGGRIGRVVAVPFSAWALAFFACDYRWEQQEPGEFSLGRRIERAERSWAFLVGFGLVPALLVAVLPLREGAAAVHCALAVMVVIACGRQEEEEEEEGEEEGEDGQGAGGGSSRKDALGPPPPPLPLFALARAPADAILRLVF